VSKYSTTRANIQTILDALGYSESDFPQIEEDAPLSDLTAKGYAFRPANLSLSESQATHLSGNLDWDLVVIVIDEGRTPSMIEDSVDRLETAIQQISAKQPILGGSLELQEDFLILVLTVRTGRL